MRIRIVLLKMTCVSFLIDADEIVAGRRCTNNDAANPNLSLDDREVSRRHARLWEEGGVWYIADLKSKNGTFVGGRDIRGLGKIEIRPGAQVKTGATGWTFIPEDWFFYFRDSFFICGEALKVFSCAAYHCGKPLIDSLSVTNAGDARTDATELSVRLDGYCDLYRAEVPGLNPGEQARVESMRTVFCLHALRRHEHTYRTQLLMKTGNQDAFEAVCEITALGFWDWIYDERFPESVAALIFPHDSAVRGITGKAEGLLCKISGYSNYSGLTASGSDDTELLVMDTVYSYLRNNGHIGYEYPCIGLSNESDAFYQTVKPPFRIISGGRDSGNATCLDLALLFAACCESIGLFPLIILTGTAGAPAHALAGCWAGATAGARPVIRSIEYIRNEMDSGNLIALECTGFAAYLGDRKGMPDFGEAVNSGREHLMAAKWICAVDVRAVRAPFGNVSPMDSVSDPLVAFVHEAARELAVKKRRSRIETSFLFYGLLRNPGEAIELFASEKIDAASICGRLESLIPEGTANDEPVRTNGYRECMYLSEEYAMQAGSEMIREQDLWWALIHKSRSNKNFMQLCRRLEIDMKRMESALEKHYPKPGAFMTESFEFSS